MSISFKYLKDRIDKKKTECFDRGKGKKFIKNKIINKGWFRP